MFSICFLPMLWFSFLHFFYPYVGYSLPSLNICHFISNAFERKKWSSLFISFSFDPFTLNCNLSYLLYLCSFSVHFQFWKLFFKSFDSTYFCCIVSELLSFWFLSFASCIFSYCIVAHCKIEVNPFCEHIFFWQAFIVCKNAVLHLFFLIVTSYGI